MVFIKQGRFDEAEKLLMQAIAIAEKSGNEMDPDLVNYHNNLAVIYWKTNRLEKAEPIFAKGLQGSVVNLLRNFTFLSEEQKSINMANADFDGYRSFYLDYVTQKPSVGGAVYNIELILKGIILIPALQCANRF